MRYSKLAFIGGQFVARKCGMSKHGINGLQQLPSPFPHAMLHSMPPSGTRLFSSREGDKMALQHIGKNAMEEIVEDYEQGGREDSGYVIMDVREPHEIEYTGKVSEHTLTFPLQKLAQYNAFALEEDEFEEIFGFEKPSPDETLVFSCAAGIRSVHAAQLAAQAGYTKLVNYAGGANEWFH